MLQLRLYPKLDLILQPSVGNLALFAGGEGPDSSYSNVVDIFNASSNTWSSTTLSQARYGLAATYWTTASLSVARFHLASTSVGNLVFFAGRCTEDCLSDPLELLQQ